MHLWCDLYNLSTLMRIAASMTYCSIVWIHEICKNNGFSRPIFTVMAIFTGFLSIFPTVSPDYDQSIDIQNNTNSVSMRGVSPGALRFVSFCCIMHWARNNHWREVGSVWYSLWLLEYFEVFSPSIWSYFVNKYFQKKLYFWKFPNQRIQMKIIEKFLHSCEENIVYIGS